MAARVLSYSLFIALLLSALAVGVSGKESVVELFEATDSRGRVVQAAYAYYPDKAELRVRLTLDNRMVKSGLYRNAEVIRHLLALLSGNDHELFCTYKGNAILAVFTEHKR
jgi:hypothetical protein